MKETDIFNNELRYYSEDIHVIRQQNETFDLSQFFNSEKYSNDYLPQLRGTDVSILKNGSVVSSIIIPNHGLEGTVS